MTEQIKIRQIVEFQVNIDDRDPGAVEEFKERISQGRVDSQDADGPVTLVLTEVVMQKRLPNYILDCDYENELHILISDGEEVFSHRDHKQVVLKWAELTGEVANFYKNFNDPERWKSNSFLDYGDPDKSWAIIRGTRAILSSDK